MTATAADTVTTRLERWRRFLAPDAAPGFLFLVGYADPPAPDDPRPPLWPETKDARVEWAWRQYERMRSRAAWLDDDAIPYLNMLTGTEIFAEAFGCEVHRPEGTNPFALPLVHSAAEADRVTVPDLGDSSLAYLFEMADALKRRGGDEALLRLVDIQSPMDIAALIWDKADLFVAMIKTPDAVHALAEKVRALLAAFLDEWFRRYGTTYVAHYPEYPMFGGLTLSEDEIGAVRPDMFDTFFLPHLAALSERYGGIGVHCCADSVHQWDGLARIPGLRLLNLCAPFNRDKKEFVTGAYERFAPVCAQMHFGWAPDPATAWPDHFPAGTRGVFSVPAATREEAVRIAAELRRRQAD